jgi:predicted metalloendopeptidase
MRNKLFRFLTAALVLYSFTLGAMAQSKAFDVSRMDTTADACDDFFQFANGNWVKNTPIPPSQARWGSFNSLAESNRDVEHDILEKAAKETNATGDIKLIGDFYAYQQHQVGRRP